MSADGEAPVLTATDGLVRIITLNRPERQNAWIPAMSDLYTAALEAAARDPAVRAIVVTGSGGHFCSGGDGQAVGAMAGGEAPLSDGGRRPPWMALRVAKPVVAAVGGVCFGVGLFHALCCDVRFAADDLKVSTAYARRGLPAEFGVSWLLSRLTGTGRAADLLFSARVVRAEEAAAIGLVSRVVPAASLLDEALAYAKGLAANSSPQSLRMMKLQLYADLAAAFPEAFERAGTLLSGALKGGDFAEGVKSWREKRAPAFDGLDPALGLLEVR